MPGTAIEEFFRHLCEAASAAAEVDDFDLQSEDPESIARWNQLVRQEHVTARLLVRLVADNSDELLAYFDSRP